MSGAVRRQIAFILAAFAVATSGAATARPTKQCILIVEETAGQLTILDPEGNVRVHVALGERPHEIAVSRDGRTAYVPMFGIADYNNRIGTPGRLVARIDLRTAKLTGTFDLPPGLQAPHGAQLRPHSGRELFSNAEVGGDVMVVFDTRTGKVLRQFPLPEATHNFIFSEDGDSIYSFAGKRGGSRLDAETGRVLAHVDIGSPARGLRLLRDHQIAVAGKGEIVIADAMTLAIMRRLKAPVEGQLAYLETLPDGTIIAPSLGDDGIVIFDPGGPARFIATGKTALVARAARSGKIYVSNVLDDHISVIEAGGRSALALSQMQGPNGLAFGACPSAQP